MADKNIFKQIEEQKKIISYLQDKYKNDTGCEIVLPQDWTTFLGQLSFKVKTLSRLKQVQVRRTRLFKTLESSMRRIEKKMNTRLLKKKIMKNSSMR